MVPKRANGYGFITIELLALWYVCYVIAIIARYWIGGQREKGVWIWQGHYIGSINYSFWDSGHPTRKDCISMFKKGVCIRDNRCTSWGDFRGIMLD